MELERALPAKLNGLINACCSIAPCDRPGMQAVAEQLLQIKGELELQAVAQQLVPSPQIKSALQIKCELELKIPDYQADNRWLHK
eukprot:361896-Chlamydomonas_euryale.AAC.1